jgi:hypothetical protein
MAEVEAIGKQIADYVNDPIEKAKRLIVTPVGQARMVVCTPSPGKGASSAIEAANSLLSEDDQIALVEDVSELTDPAQVVAIINDGGIEPEKGYHVAFSLFDEAIARQVEKELDLKVFTQQ